MLHNGTMNCSFEVNISHCCRIFNSSVGQNQCLKVFRFDSTQMKNLNIEQVEEVCLDIVFFE